MKHYPTIEFYKNQSNPVYVFDKLDGSNMRIEWSKKQGIYKTGSRNVLIDSTHDVMGDAEALLKAWEDDLAKIFKEQRWDRVVCFFEYYGKTSAFGQHIKNEPHKVTLIDVAPHKQGILLPKDFVKLFGHLDIPEVLHVGKVNSDFVKSVRESTLEGMTFEGVVCKESSRKKKFSKPVMFKVKSQAWLDALKEYCKEDEHLYKMLM